MIQNKLVANFKVDLKFLVIYFVRVFSLVVQLLMHIHGIILLFKKFNVRQLYFTST